MNSSRRVGLVLTGGGARAAYQAGVLKGISDILGKSTGGVSPFQCITGISAGGINSSFIASKADRFVEAAEQACELWSGLKAEMILKTDAPSLGGLAFKWIKDLSFGGVTGRSSSTFILPTEPLRELIGSQFDFKMIKKHLDSGLLHGVALSATNYKTGTAITFYDGSNEIQPWVRSSRLGRRSTLTLDHVLASAAIPILFAPVKLENSFYGDGSIRLRAPLSPAIHLGADRVLAIGIRYLRLGQETVELNQSAKMDRISLADISGVLLNASFMDSLEADVERLERINHTLSLLPKGIDGKPIQHPEGLRPIPLLVMRPSIDLGQLASEQFNRFPRMLRYLLKGIGASAEKGWDLLSYLAFDGAYTGQLIELGKKDAMARRDEIVEFFK